MVRIRGLVGIRSPNLHVSEVRLQLLVNEEPSKELERRWDYYFATCHLCDSEFTGQRNVSRSPTSDDDWNRDAPTLVDVS